MCRNKSQGNELQRRVEFPADELQGQHFSVNGPTGFHKVVVSSPHGKLTNSKDFTRRSIWKKHSRRRSDETR